MKPQSFYIDTDEECMLEVAENRGTLQRAWEWAAAAVDVVSSEPMKADNPLLGAPNLMITPHMAWASVEARTRLVQTVADNCRSWLEGKGQNVL